MHEFDNRLTAGVVAVLRQGIALIKRLDDASFTAGGRGSVGGHFRHCLDFVNCFLAGAKSGEIDYGRRTRDKLIETDRSRAVLQIEAAIEKLRRLPVLDAARAVSVKSETSEAQLVSSIGRELEILHSHTTHHYALIAFKLEARNVKVAADFGVAPATLKFWQQQNAAKRAA